MCMYVVYLHYVQFVHLSNDVLYFIIYFRLVWPENLVIGDSTARDEHIIHLDSPRQ